MSKYVEYEYEDEDRDTPKEGLIRVVSIALASLAASRPKMSLDAILRGHRRWVVLRSTSYAKFWLVEINIHRPPGLSTLKLSYRSSPEFWGAPTFTHRISQLDAERIASTAYTAPFPVQRVSDETIALATEMILVERGSR